MFYSDVPRKNGRLHTLIIILSHCYMQYSDLGYERTVDFKHVCWC